ncbi:MAG: Gx transporter family protein [Bacilli bacterium]
MNHQRIQKLTRLAMLLALGVLLNYAEAVLLPTAFIAPGVKLGIANTVGLMVLYLEDDQTFFFYGFMRVLMTSLFTGFGFNFLIALSGWFIASLAVMLAKSNQQLSIFGLSIVSAVLHGVGQILMVMVLYQSVFMLNYLPVLIVSGLMAGLLVASVSQQVLLRLEKGLR